MSRSAHYRQLGLSPSDDLPEPEIISAGVRVGPRGTGGAEGATGPRGLFGSEGAAGPTDPAWTIISSGDGSLATQLTGALDGQKFWLEPGIWTCGDVAISADGVVVAGSFDARVDVDDNERIVITGDSCQFVGFRIRIIGSVGFTYVMNVAGAYTKLRDLYIDVDVLASRRTDCIVFAAGSVGSVLADSVLVQAAVDILVDCDGGAADRVVIRYNRFDLTGMTDWTYCILASGAGVNEGTLVEHNRFVFDHGDHTGIGPSDEWRIVGNYCVGDTGGTGYFIDCGLDVDHVQVVENYGELIDYFVYLVATADGWSICSNTVDKSEAAGGDAIYIAGGCTQFVISHNNLTARDGIVLAASTGPFRTFAIVGNTILAEQAGSGNGISMAGAPTLESITITGNTIRDFTRGVVATNTARSTISFNSFYLVNDGITATGAGGVELSIVGNSFWGRSQVGDTGIELNVADCIVAFNQLLIGFDTANWRAIVLQAAAGDNNELIGNIFTDATDGGAGNSWDHNFGAVH